MRILSLAAVTTFVVIAACSDVASPLAAGSDAGSLTAAGGAAHFLGGKKKIDVRSKHGHHDEGDRAECGDDDRDHHDYWGKRRHGRHEHHWGKRGHSVFSRGKHGFSGHMLGGHHEDGEDCGGGTETTGTISGAVMNDGAAASGFPVFLLNEAGTAVLANTTTATDGSYSFAGVAAGNYLVCETDPFVAIYGFLGQTRPETGPACPVGYAPIGFLITLDGGATVGGNDFSNFGET